MEADEELFDADFLASLRRLFARLQYKRSLQNTGSQLSLAQGSSREFKDRRAYVEGDDYRNIDWNLYARFERLFIRLFENIQEFHVHLLVDCSVSMRRPFPEKRIIALRAALALGYLALCNNHRVSYHLLGHQVDRMMPPLKGQGHIHQVLQHLAGLEFSFTGDPAPALRRFRPGRSGKGMLFVCSDLLGPDPTGMVEAVRKLGLLPVSTHLVHILHPRELELDLQGAWHLQSVEGDGERRVFLGERERTRYHQILEQWREEVRSAASGRRIDYLFWPTDVPFDEQMIALLERGHALVGRR